jgi:hypothetical protein
MVVIPAGVTDSVHVSLVLALMVVGGLEVAPETVVSTTVEERDTDAVGVTVTPDGVVCANPTPIATNCVDVTLAGARTSKFEIVVKVTIGVVVVPVGP